MLLIVIIVIVVSILNQYYHPKPAKLADEVKIDSRIRLLDALSSYTGHEFRAEDHCAPTTRYFTPADLLVAIESIELELEVDIPRKVYWKDTIGEVVDSIAEFIDAETDAGNRQADDG